MRLAIILCVVGTGAAGFILAFPVGFSAWVMVAIIAGGILLLLVGLLGVVWGLEGNSKDKKDSLCQSPYSIF